MKIEYIENIFYPRGETPLNMLVAGLRTLQDREHLETILQRLIGMRNFFGRFRNDNRFKPILVKIAPDLECSAIDEIIEVCSFYRVDGIIAVNTTIQRSGLKTPINEMGGLSGAPLYSRAFEVIRYLGQNLPPEMLLIGVGGVFTGRDAYAMLRAGAHLIQVLTSFVYRGPLIAQAINSELVGLMERDDIRHISQLRGERK